MEEELPVANSDDFVHKSHLKTGSKTAKSPRVKTTYPKDGQISYRNPGQTTFELSDSKHIREYVSKMIGKANQVLGPKAKELFEKGNNITQTTAIGSPITEVVKQWDKTFKAEATGNSNVLEMMTKLRRELNTPDMSQFTPNQANKGSIMNIQGILGGQLMGIFNMMGQLAQQTGQKQNQNQDQNKQSSTIKTVDANGNIISIT